eukprot:g5412.t1
MPLKRLIEADRSCEMWIEQTLPLLLRTSKARIGEGSGRAGREQEGHGDSASTSSSTVVTSDRNNDLRVFAAIYPRRRLGERERKKVPAHVAESYERFLQNLAISSSTSKLDGFEICGLSGSPSNRHFQDALQRTLRTIREARNGALARKCENVQQISETITSFMIRSLSSPLEVAISVLCGIDYVESSYPLDAARKGRVVDATISIASNSARASSVPPRCRICVDTMHLWDKQYVVDTRPLVDGCACFACQHHTRAYVHHLLNTHEILGTVLLHVHNIFNAMSFVKSLEDARDRSGVRDVDLSEMRPATSSIRDSKSSARRNLPIFTSSATAAAIDLLTGERHATTGGGGKKRANGDADNRTKKRSRDEEDGAGTHVNAGNTTITGGDDDDDDDETSTYMRPPGDIARHTRVGPAFQAPVLPYYCDAAALVETKKQT